MRLVAFGVVLAVALSANTSIDQGNGSLNVGDGRPIGSLLAHESLVNGTAVIDRLEESLQLEIPMGGSTLKLEFGERNHSYYIGTEGPFPRLLKVVPSADIQRGRVSYLTDDPASLAGDFELYGETISFQLRRAETGADSYKWQVFGTFPNELPEAADASDVEGSNTLASAASQEATLDGIEYGLWEQVDETLEPVDENYPSEPHDYADSSEPSIIHAGAPVGSYALRANFIAAQQPSTAYTHNFYTVIDLMADDINERAFAQETLVIIYYNSQWNDYRSCGSDADCFVDAVASDEGMPANDNLDGTAFYMTFVDGPLEAYDSIAGNWKWVLGRAKGPLVAGEYAENPAEAVQYQYYDSASDTAYHTGQSAAHEITHHLGHPQHDSARRGCCWKDYNLMYKTGYPAGGHRTYWFTGNSEAVINEVGADAFALQ